MLDYVFSVKKSRDLFLSTVFFGFLIAGCGERSGQITVEDSTISCSNSSEPMKLLPITFDEASNKGWRFQGPSFPEQKKDVLMGRFDNMIVMEIPVESGLIGAKVKLQVSGTVPTAKIILDTIFFAGDKEVGRGAPNLDLGQTLSNTLSTTLSIPTGAQRLQLIARPWREVDGILTVGEGEIIWCKK